MFFITFIITFIIGILSIKVNVFLWRVLLAIISQLHSVNLSLIEFYYFYIDFLIVIQAVEIVDCPYPIMAWKP